MSIFNYILKKSSKSNNPVRLTSHMHAAEIMCACWNNLNSSIIEPYLSEDIEWKGDMYFEPQNASVWVIDQPITIRGKKNYLNYLNETFERLKLLKNSFSADIVCENDEYRARVTIDHQDKDEVNRLTIENGLITKIEIMPSFEWWGKEFGSSPFGVISQTDFHEQAAAVAAIELYVKSEIGDIPIKWATPYELKNSHCQLSFTCDGLSYDVLVEIHSFDDRKARFVMKSEYDRLLDGCRKNNHIPCILALNEDMEFSSLTLSEDADMRIKQLRNKNINEWTFRQLFKNEIQLSHLRITKDHRIFLSEYNNIEVKMEPINKAVYLLFLKHPEGIIFKHLPDYRKELAEIYQRIRPLGLNERAIQSIENVTNPCLNSINEKCARIRSAFISQFDESIAKNYFVTGNRGEAKKISLPRDLVVWE